MTQFLLLLIIFGYSIITCHYLTRKRKQVENNFKPADLLLQKMLTSISTIQSFITPDILHEEQAFSLLSTIPTKEYHLLTLEDKIEVNDTINTITPVLRLLTEKYPRLQASEDFIQLQQTILETNKQLAIVLKTYNTYVSSYNRILATTPANIIANLFNFYKKTPFNLPQTKL